MKAADYFREYGEDVLQEALRGDKTDALTKMYLEFVREMKEIIASRSVNTDRGVVAVVKEQNYKWNAMCALYEKKYSADLCPLKRDGFLNSIKTNLPEITAYLIRD